MTNTKVIVVGAGNINQIELVRLTQALEANGIEVIDQDQAFYMLETSEAEVERRIFALQRVDPGPPVAYMYPRKQTAPWGKKQRFNRTY